MIDFILNNIVLIMLTIMIVGAIILIIGAIGVCSSRDNHETYYAIAVLGAFVCLLGSIFFALGGIKFA